jgi:hypothetical protein
VVESITFHPFPGLDAALFTGEDPDLVGALLMQVLLRVFSKAAGS